MTNTTRRLAAFAFTTVASALLLLGSVGPASVVTAAPLAPTAATMA